MDKKLVYVITDGEYSSYHIKGVALTREDAELFVAKFGGGIEEHIDSVPYMREGWSVYIVHMSQAGDARSIRGDQEPHGFYSGFTTGLTRAGEDRTFFTNCWAQSADHAVKIANERRLQILAADAWNKSLEQFDFNKQ